MQPKRSLDAYWRSSAPDTEGLRAHAGSDRSLRIDRNGRVERRGVRRHLPAIRVIRVIRFELQLAMPAQ